ncbi:hypothetical protein [Kamptonema sp. UHCC 0994]|uniref:hypothetical protein n=1 Tax=Kamptonema sp. UHCC 0994 TaxID=3031329 RepID=UPI0023B8F8F4|nr:hypothetical protein [Kamptonema sp. UHCC 0994]MDF0555951.1 hypothetical protein [Kamptonema sp. UHCC 0994]
MEPDRQDLRRASARAFFESLDQMNELARAQEASQAAKSNSTSVPSPAAKQKKPKPQFSFAELEEAIADIEQFMQSREENRGDGEDGEMGK